MQETPQGPGEDPPTPEDPGVRAPNPPAPPAQSIPVSGPCYYGYGGRKHRDPLCWSGGMLDPGYGGVDPAPVAMVAERSHGRGTPHPPMTMVQSGLGPDPVSMVTWGGAAVRTIRGHPTGLVLGVSWRRRVSIVTGGQAGMLHTFLWLPSGGVGGGIGGN